jgi:hypothetical protein
MKSKIEFIIKLIHKKLIKHKYNLNDVLFNQKI